MATKGVLHKEFGDDLLSHRDYTIIGAGLFHCPVRDGKEWDQTAMVAKHKLSNWQAVYQLFIYYFILSYFGDECIHQ